MSSPEPLERIVVPLINTNEPESQVVELGAQSYSPITRGDIVCTLETSKSTVDVESEHDGYTGPLQISLHERVTAGQPICDVFAEMPELAQDAEGGAEVAAPSGLKLTRKAEKLAREAGLDLSAVASGGFLTEADVRALIAESEGGVELDDEIAAAIHGKAVLVYGAGGFAKVLVDQLRSAGKWEPICAVDDSPDAAPDVLGVPVLGGRRYLVPLRERGLEHAVNAVGAIGRMQTRIDIFEQLESAGYRFPTVIDPDASVAASATLAAGAQVFAQAVVSSAATVGKGTIVNTGAIVSHDCIVGDYVHLAPGCILAGEVEVGRGALVGMGVTARVGLKIGDGAIIGNGSVLSEDVPAETIVSAGSAWPK